LNHTAISRRGFLALAAAGGCACGRKRATAIQGYCLVANQGSRSVAVVSLEAFRVEKQIPLDAAPSMVVGLPGKGKAFVLAPDSGTVYEIDIAAMKISRRARVGTAAVGMRLSPLGDALWVLGRDPALLVELPVNSLKPARRIHLASPPDVLDVVALSDGTVLAAAASTLGRSITLARLDKAAVKWAVATSVEPSLIQFRQDGQQVIAGSWRDRSVTILDAAAGKTLVRLPLPLAPRHFCVGGGGGQLFVSGDGMDAVVVIFPFSTEIYQTMLAGRAPGVMACADPSYLLVTNPESSGITVLSTDTYDFVAVVGVGRGPCDIQLTPDGQFALVLNEGSGDLAVIRTQALATTPTGAQRRYKSAPLFTLIPVGERPVSAAVVVA
jgi:DNA-binding beta-propeller fold protein YncE